MKPLISNQTLKSVILFTILSFCFTIVNAQSESSESQPETVLQVDSITVPETYEQNQDGQPDLNSSGTATYNIVEENEQSSSGAAEWRTASDVEELRVYSGYHNGNNVIKTIEVPIPQR